MSSLYEGRLVSSELVSAKEGFHLKRVGVLD